MVVAVDGLDCTIAEQQLILEHLPAAHIGAIDSERTTIQRAIRDSGPVGHLQVGNILAHHRHCGRAGPERCHCYRGDLNDLRYVILQWDEQ